MEGSCIAGGDAENNYPGPGTIVDAKNRAKEWEEADTASKEEMEKKKK